MIIILLAVAGVIILIAIIKLVRLATHLVNLASFIDINRSGNCHAPLISTAPCRSVWRSLPGTRDIDNDLLRVSFEAFKSARVRLPLFVSYVFEVDWWVS